MQSIDPDTGEVLSDDDAAPPRRRRPLTREEQVERERVLDRRAELRQQEVAALRVIVPACETEDDPPVVWRKPVRMGGRPSDILHEAERLSGSGLPGSKLVIVARSYDGAGPNGGEAHDYVTAFVSFRDASGYLRRSMGVAIRASELRDVARVLGEYADSIESERKVAP